MGKYTIKQADRSITGFIASANNCRFYYNEDTYVRIDIEEKYKASRLKNLIFAEYLARTKNINTMEFKNDIIIIHINDLKTIWYDISVAADIAYHITGHYNLAK